MKKIVSLLMIAILIISSVSALAYTDIDNDTEENKKLIEVLPDIEKYSLINGYEDGSFRPDNCITRAEMIQLICNLKFGANIDYSML